MTKMTPLLFACGIERLDAVRALVAAGAKVEQATEAGAMPLHVAALAGNLAIVEFLVAHAALLEQASK
jgi:ankyrin repeat protein